MVVHGHVLVDLEQAVPSGRDGVYSRHGKAHERFAFAYSSLCGASLLSGELLSERSRTHYRGLDMGGTIILNNV
jgi:hypothetical protein